MNSQSIYPDDFAKMLLDRVGEKYQPSNGTEGDCFRAVWCDECARDKHLNGEIVDIAGCDEDDLCRIVDMTMAYNVEDKEYPKEWQYGKDGQPCCTAFIPAGSPIPPPPDTLTIDMFKESP